MSDLTIGQCATIACVHEATAPKPGNVHPRVSFSDMSFTDMLVAAQAIGPVMDAAVDTRVGQTILQAVRVTREATGKNVNLGIVLLIAPLATVPRDEPLDGGATGGVGKVLSSLTADDARDVYEAIRIARPGGLGRSETDDVHETAPRDLLVAMGAAANRDRIARQYATGFRDVFDEVVPSICRGIDRDWILYDVIVHTQMELMSRFPDSLIARKCGEAVARQSARMAEHVLAAGEPVSPAYMGALQEFDDWLRADGHRRNPGTTADLVCAGLFVGFREGLIE